ncbi:hypothetical protein Ahy_A03g017036 isoform B [Arachis hypogaea]|uniref:Transcription factor CBF/NF-Y/archaeal histone domain-containing protein n=1 Tax=Arachis hypogaea TaxID=3818 RepID=A0A445E533_ARAHY|nr:hypothetical protein Ahy_A03g017036 isoform B [Arachis hypogaea]
MAEEAKAVPEAEELPRTIVRRIVKDKISRCSEDGDISVNKDALLAFSESARIFIHYISATKKNAGKKAAVSKEKESEKNKKRKVEGEPSGKVKSDNGESPEKGDSGDAE